MSENLKQTLQTIISTSMSVDKALEDNRISPLEWAQIAIKSIGFWKAIKNIDQLKEEFVSLTPDEKMDLSDYVAKNLDLRNENLEETIEKLFESLIQISSVLLRRQKV
jgi:hypothetical protein